MRTFCFILIVHFINVQIYPQADYVFPDQEVKKLYIDSYNASLELWDYPFEEMDIQTSLGTAHIIAAGPKTGDPIVLFHGTDASSTMWFPNVAAFAEKNRIYAIDYPLEAGKSRSARRTFTNRQLAQFYKEVFAKLDLHNITLAGVSRGGWVATYLALQPDNRISKLVLLSPARAFSGVENLAKVASALRLKFFPSKKNSDRFFERFSHQPKKIDPVFQKQLYYAYKYGRSKPGILKMHKFSEKKLRKLNIPVLVLIGDHDIVNGQKMIRKVNLYLPSAQTVVIKDAGHFLSIDQATIVNRIVTDFVAKDQEQFTGRFENLSAAE